MAFPSSTPFVVKDPITEKNADGFALTLRSIYRQGEEVRATLCFTMPSTDDWQVVEGASLMVGGIDYPPSGGGLTDITSRKAGDRRCAYVLFAVPKWQELKDMRLDLKKIATSYAPESTSCAEAQSRLHAKRIWITIYCVRGDHTAGFRIADKPEGMTEEEALQLGLTEGFMDSVKGPWIFLTDPFTGVEK